LETAIVILNWNGLELLKTFLPDVVKHSPEARVYIIDNASTDHSLEYIDKNFPEVVSIALDKNLGYAAGYNEGLKKVKEDIIILLNNDVKVTKNWLKPIKSKFETHKEVAVIQPKILDYKNPQYFEYAGAAGGFVDAFGYPFCRGRIFSTLEKDEGQYDIDSEIFWASGACFAVRKKVFNELKGFDDTYFAHQEEIDLCWRVFNAGYKIWYCHHSKVYHLGGATLEQLNPKKTYLNFRNSLYNIIKNVPEPHWFNVLFLRLLLDGLAALRFLFSGQFSHIIAVIKAHWTMFSRFYVYFRKRRKVLKPNYFRTRSIIYNFYILKRKKYTDLE
jgi:GT2 family glycosyltransferase